ncbi:MAG: acyl-CoA thioesterase [Acidimicrobiales bacterium]
MSTTPSLHRDPAPPGDRADAGPDHRGTQSQPGFVWQTSVFFDDLDAMGMLHNAAYLVLVERATSAFFETHGWHWEKDPAQNPDQYYVVREQSVRYLEPIVGPGDVEVELWVRRLGRTSAAFGFEVRSSGRVRAVAERVHVKLDPLSLKPAAWTATLRSHLATLVQPATR